MAASGGVRRLPLWQVDESKLAGMILL